MPSVTHNSSTTIPFSTGKNFVITQLTADGGRGDDCPATLGGNAAWGSNGGGGGCTVSGVSIPNQDILDAVAVEAFEFTYTRAEEDSTFFGINAGGLTLHPGETGDTHGNSDDQAEGGGLDGDTFGWITDEANQVAMGGPANSDGPGSAAGRGGGSAGGRGGVDGNISTAQAGGAAVDAFTGVGGNGGNDGNAGEDGLAPGGGGGGGGHGTTVGGAGAAGCLILAYDPLEIAFTSNGGGATATINVTQSQAGNTLTTLVATEDPDFPGVAYRIIDADDGALFQIGGDNSDELSLRDPLAVGQYIVDVAVHQAAYVGVGDPADTQAITLNITEDATGNPALHYAQMMNN